MLAARSHDLYGGILDVNVRGQTLYPIADVLVARQIPFVFMTGYGAHSVDSRFCHVPVRQKPVEVQSFYAALATMQSSAN